MARGHQQTGVTLEADLLRQVVDSAKQLMLHESIPIFKDICERPLAVVDLGREELRRLAQVNEGVQSALASAANICQSGRLSLGPFLRSVAAQMTDAIQQSKRRQASYRHLRQRVEA